MFIHICVLFVFPQIVCVQNPVICNTVILPGYIISQNVLGRFYILYSRLDSSTEGIYCMKAMYVLCTLQKEYNTATPSVQCAPPPPNTLNMGTYTSNIELTRIRRGSFIWHTIPVCLTWSVIVLYSFPCLI